MEIGNGDEEDVSVQPEVVEEVESEVVDAASAEEIAAWVNGRHTFNSKQLVKCLLLLLSVGSDKVKWRVAEEMIEVHFQCLE